MIKTKLIRTVQKMLACTLIIGIMLGCVPTKVYAADTFDPVFYATLYPDVVAVYGYNADALYKHYVKYGQKEKRLPSATSLPGAKASLATSKSADNQSIANEQNIQSETGIVPLKNISNLSNIKKKCTDQEIQQAYNAALRVVTPLVGKSQQEQLTSVMQQLRTIFENTGTYSMSNNHYNDPYGYLVLGTASCAGSTRTTILCLKMLGFSSVEHVHENKYCHQWARVRMSDGSYWICDPFGLYAGPEPAPYVHPYSQ